MTHLPPLHELDRDGAIQETADKVDPQTRASFLKKAGVGIGTLAAGSAFAGALPNIARSQAIPKSDIDILNFALVLEELEAAFYATATANGIFRGRRELGRFSLVVGQHERVHVLDLRKVLGARAVAKPKFDFRETVTDVNSFAATAQVLEDTGVHAYLGQAGNIKTKAILLRAAQILAVEARHAAWIRDIRFSGGTTPPTTPAPAAFETPLTKAQILARVNGTKFIVP